MITYKDITSLLPKPNCRAVIKISINNVHGPFTANDKMQETINWWVKDIIEGKIALDREFINHLPSELAEGRLCTLSEEDNWKLDRTKFMIREYESQSRSTSRLVQLGLWRTTAKTVKGYCSDMSSRWVKLIPSTGQVKKAIEWYNTKFNTAA